MLWDNCRGSGACLNPFFIITYKSPLFKEWSPPPQNVRICSSLFFYYKAFNWGWGGCIFIYVKGGVFFIEDIFDLYTVTKILRDTKSQLCKHWGNRTLCLCSLTMILYSKQNVLSFSWEDTTWDIDLKLKSQQKKFLVFQKYTPLANYLTPSL
jgi:hypothetical protein